jgi:pimeloyl-ACP methyl ester carboxylesterase
VSGSARTTELPKGAWKPHTMVVRIIVWCCILSALAGSVFAWRARAAPNDFEQRACSYDKLPAFCGTLRVPEDRTNAASRAIVLHFVRVPAHRGSSETPIVWFDGGPGESVISDFSDGGIQGYPLAAAMHETHELLLLDQRGTGLSNQLQCPMYPRVSEVFAQIFPLDSVRRCRARLAKSSDLSAYGTDAAADDLDAVRRRLEYPRIIAIGGSYGTTAALVYMRRYPHVVQSALLIGVAPTFFKIPLPQLQAGQRALDDLERSCARDATCHAHFPNFPAEFRRLLAQSTTGIPVNYRDAHTGEQVRAALARPVFADTVRLLLYAPASAALIPLLIHEAAAGDTTPLAKAIAAFAQAVFGGTAGEQAMGDNFSVNCQEGVAFITPAEAARESANSFMAGSILEARQASCAIWNVRPADAGFIEPVRSSVPVLMMSGADDPATDARYATRQLAYLLNGRQIIVPNGGHINDDPCLERLEVRFVETSSAAGLDAACVKRFSRPPFATSLSAIPKWLQ